MTMRACFLALGFTALAGTAMAQPATVDPRWAPYLGCWQLQNEAAGSALTDMVAVAARQAKAEATSEDVMICVTPATEANAVSQQTVLNGNSVLDEVIAADGAPRTGSDASCTSTRRAEWSASGRQLFTRGTVTCEGQPERTITGMSLVTPGPTWIDVQLVEVRASRSVRVRRYVQSREQRRLARDPLPGAVGPMERWTLDEVKEASRHTAPEVIQAALVEVGTKLPLNARRLVELDDAGVAAPVIDVMMALSFPDKFVIERGGSWYGGASGGGGGGFGGTLDPWLLSSDLAWLSMYSPFGYQYYGYYDPRYGSGWGNNWVGVVPPVSGGQPVDDPNGRVVNGQGYTRVRPREPEPRITGYVDRSGGADSGRGAGSSGGGNVTSGGYSGGSSDGGASSGGSGRTAVPRPPGGQER